MEAPHLPIWTPLPVDIKESRLAHFIGWLRTERGIELRGYHELWAWSVADLEAFWEALWTYCGVRAHAPYRKVLSSREMPGVRWFEGAELNFAEHLLLGAPDDVAVIEADETGLLQEVTYGELARQVGAAQTGLRELGVGRGSRVVAYLPNGLAALVSFIATAGLGAMWSSCAPEFGTTAVLDRFAQLEPDVLLAAGSYAYGGRIFDRRAEIRLLQQGLPTLRATVALPGPLRLQPESCLSWHMLQRDQAMPEFSPVPFDHPLWVLYSSGTSGKPKGIVHGHGGILLESLKQIQLQMDLGPHDRFAWYTTTGWMMWNVVVSGLLSGGTILLYDGSPSHPDLLVLWRLVERARLTYLGISAGFVQSCFKAGLRPAAICDLSSLRAIGSTGSPLSEEGFRWLATAVRSRIPIASLSGGTDVCTSFLSSCRILPVFQGELQCRALGVDVAAYNEAGSAVVGEVGELVVRQPMPSMPVSFWRDPDNIRYRDAYFSQYPGVWRHGDWVLFTERGSAVIYGRSDATLNRGGVRMGTSEFYGVIEELPEVADSLVVEYGSDSTSSRLVLFVVTAPGFALTQGLVAKIRDSIRRELSPRHLPDEVIGVRAIPRTINGKKLEIPVRRILEGAPVEQAVSLGSVGNPAALDEFVLLRDRIGQQT